MAAKKKSTSRKSAGRSRPNSSSTGKKASSRSSSRKTATSRKKTGSKTSSRRTASSRKTSSSRRYGPKAQNEVRTEMRHMKQGKHPVKNRKQAIAIGLSKARRKGGKVPPRKKAA